MDVPVVPSPLFRRVVAVHRAAANRIFDRLDHGLLDRIARYGSDRPGGGLLRGSHDILDHPFQQRKYVLIADVPWLVGQA